MRKEYPWQRPYASLSLFLSELLNSARSSKSIAARMNGLKGVHKPANKINPLEFTQVISGFFNTTHICKDMTPKNCWVSVWMIYEFWSNLWPWSWPFRGFEVRSASQHCSTWMAATNLLMKNMGLNILFLSFCWIQIIICSRCSLFLKDSVGFA